MSSGAASNVPPVPQCLMAARAICPCFQHRSGFQRPDQLKAAGCDRVFSEKASGKSKDGRYALQKALGALEPGDTLIVVRLDRLARSVRDLLGLMDTIKAAGAHIKALDDPWLDTTTPHGELILTIMGGMAEFERKLIRARCDEGIKEQKHEGPCLVARLFSMPVNDASSQNGMQQEKQWPNWHVNTIAVLQRFIGL